MIKKMPYVLIIEDNAIASKVVEYSLSSYGFSCDVVRNGRDAILKLNQNKYDLVFLDLGLPDMHGLEVLDAMKSDTVNPVPYIIILTGNSDEKYKDLALRLGAKEFLIKPFCLDNARKLKDIFF